LQTQSLNRRQTAAIDKEADGYARRRPAAAGAPSHPVEVNSTAAFATQEDTSTEGFPQPLGHPGPTTDVADGSRHLSSRHYQRRPPRRPARVHRGVQHQPSTSERAVQCARQWETIDDDSDEAAHPDRKPRGTQVEVAVRIERGTQTDSLDRSYTPPGTPPKLRRWGPRRRTSARPSIEWRERL